MKTENTDELLPTVDEREELESIDASFATESFPEEADVEPEDNEVGSIP